MKKRTFHTMSPLPETILTGRPQKILKSCSVAKKRKYERDILECFIVENCHKRLEALFLRLTHLESVKTQTEQCEASYYSMMKQLLYGMCVDHMKNRAIYLVGPSDLRTPSSIYMGATSNLVKALERHNRPKRTRVKMGIQSINHKTVLISTEGSGSGSGVGGSKTHLGDVINRPVLPTKQLYSAFYPGVHDERRVSTRKTTLRRQNRGGVHKVIQSCREAKENGGYTWAWYPLFTKNLPQHGIHSQRAVPKQPPLARSSSSGNRTPRKRKHVNNYGKLRDFVRDNKNEIMFVT